MKDTDVSMVLNFVFLLAVAALLCCILACVPAVHHYRHARQENEEDAA